MVVVLAGPNGAGKTTVSGEILRGPLAVDHFVNADAIAKGLSEFAPESVAFAAGRVMLKRLRELAAERADFAFETTLASRSFAPWLRELRATGYTVVVLYFWLPSAEMAIVRVRHRVADGGHAVPEADVRRRYANGMRNLLEIYRPTADRWRVYDNSDSPSLRLVVESEGGIVTVHDHAVWQEFQDHASTRP
ncbi:MAG: zeta toxin family protein [Armatimonadetes bacterium]|nr:zeta toxin family protein [Armatimonadota bacterium]